MNPAGLVSVALCTCEGERFLAEQLRSILDQAPPVSELVLRDDASTDATLELARTVCDAATVATGGATLRIELTVNARRLGVRSNFEAALRDCASDYIALADQDDRWPAGRVMRMLEVLHANPHCWLVHGDARLIDGHGRNMGLTLFDALNATSVERAALASGRALDVFLDRNLVTGAAVLMRRELLDLALPIPAHWLHDEWLGVIAAALNAVVWLPEPVLEYRQHGRNQIGAGQATWRSEMDRLWSPRGDWQRQRHARASELLVRLESLGSRVPARSLSAVREKVVHHAVRSELPTHRVRRILPVLKEALSGRYRRFGRGWRGVLKDLLAPA